MEMFFLVKWKGWPLDKKSGWEPLRHLEGNIDADREIDAYLKYNSMTMLLREVDAVRSGMAGKVK